MKPFNNRVRFRIRKRAKGKTEQKAGIDTYLPIRDLAAKREGAKRITSGILIYFFDTIHPKDKAAKIKELLGDMKKPPPPVLLSRRRRSERREAAGALFVLG
jgi:hypothetical protein